MWTAALSSSTFKPVVDKCIVADGTDVVLWATDRLLIRLSYQDRAWQVTRHTAAHPTSDGRGRHGAFCWCGRFYIESGEPIAALGDETPTAEWDRIYRGCRSLASDVSSLAGTD